MEHMTPKQVGKLWSMSERRVQVLCVNNQVDGAQRLGDKVWLISNDATKPVDGRAVEGKNLKIKRGDRNGESTN